MVKPLPWQRSLRSLIQIQRSQFTAETTITFVGEYTHPHILTPSYTCHRACLRVAHAPVLCEVWTKWLDHIEEMRPRVGDTSAAEADEAASNKWLADRSKPCPKCRYPHTTHIFTPYAPSHHTHPHRSPIEKTEGCNHMCCKKCKHDFCWVCLDNWKCHNSTTGGYFE